MPNDRSHRLRFGPFVVDLHTHEIWKHGTRLKLSGQPFEILAILLATPGQLVTREQLRAQLWPSDTFVGFDHGLNAAMNKLRDTLSDSVDSPRYIETLPRRGYRFIATVELLPQPASVANEFVGSAVRGGPLHATNSTASPPSSQPGAAPSVSKGADLDPSDSDNRSAPTSTSSSTSGASRHLLIGGIVLALLLAATLLLQRVSFTANRHDSFTAVQRIRPLTPLSDETSEPAFSPDGSYVALDRYSSRRESSGIFVESVGSDELLQLTHDPADGFPAWSPDSRNIAFTRETAPGAISIYILPFSPTNSASPSAERKLDTSSLTPIRRELAWSPDGKSLIFSVASGLILFDLESSSPHQLTQSPPDSQDWGPSLSPDGSRLLFVRSQGAGFHDTILSIHLPKCSGGSSDPSDHFASSSGCVIAEPTPIASDHANILGPPQWSLDSQSAIFSSDRGSHPGLWRVSLTSRETPVQINDTGSYPSLSRIGNRLAYQRITRNLHIWERDLTVSNSEMRILVSSTSETDQGPGPQISPDGKKVAYMSDRSGSMEIWVADRDGSHPQQLTSIGNAGSPRWSPDSQSIVFDAQQRTGPAIYSIRVSGGAPRLLVPSETHNNVCPSFSADGKWVYFASTRSGSFQIWKVSADGGSAVQVTQHGGHAAIASLDGKFIYYAKSPYANPEIWQVPANGGPEKLLSPLVNPVSWAAWSVTRRGIVFAHPSGQGRPVVSLYDPATIRLTTFTTLPIAPFWLSASPDACSILFDQPGWQQAQIMLVDNFR